VLVPRFVGNRYCVPYALQNWFLFKGHRAIELGSVTLKINNQQSNVNLASKSVESDAVLQRPSARGRTLGDARAAILGG
jgi:hypothetical protein